MISNQILQNTIDGVKKISGADCCVTDMDGTVMAASFTVPDPILEAVPAFAGTKAESQVLAGYRFLRVADEREAGFTLIMDAEQPDTICSLVAFQLQTLLAAYQERFDQDNFIKNLLLDNLLLVDIYNRAKKLHIDSQCKRVVYLIETGGESQTADVELLRETFSGGSARDFVTAIDESSIVVVKELSDGDSHEELAACAQQILDVFSSSDRKLRVAYGNVVKELREVSKSYKEARMSMEVGKIFFEDKPISAYSKLGIGRLIYQLPIPLCKMFIKEVFQNVSPESFDEETLMTIDKFFENNLNVSETSRQIFIHRNTLVYRLDKLEKTTGLDLRVFEDAITFKIAMMVVKYMKHMETEEY